MRAEHRLKSRPLLQQVRDSFAKQRGALRERQDRQREELRRKQRRLMARIARRLSRKVRDRHIAARAAQIETHREERRLLSATYQHEIARAKDGLAVRYTAQIGDIEARRTAHLPDLGESHRQAENFAEVLRQQREAEREQQRDITARKIREWKTRSQEGRMPGTPQELRQTAGGKSAREDAIARAVARAKRRQDEEERERERGKDRGRTR